MTLNTDNQHSTTAASRASVTAPVSNIDRINDVGISEHQEKVGNGYMLTIGQGYFLIFFYIGVVSLGVIFMFDSMLHMKHDGLKRLLNDYKARTCGS